MDKDIKKALQDIGLSDSQALTYTAILKNPLSSVADVAKIIGKNRQQIYNDAERLSEMGLLERTSKNKRKYIVSGLEKIVEIAKEREDKAKEVLGKVSQMVPELQKVAGSYRTAFKTKFYEGERGMDEAYAYELRISKGETLLSLVGEIEEVFEIFPEEYWKKWNARFRKQGSNCKMLVSNTKAARETVKNDKSYGRDTRFIEGFGLKATIDVVKNTVLIVSYKDRFALVIESEVVASSYRIMFETLWKLGKKF